MKKDGRNLIATFRSLAPPRATDLDATLECQAHPAHGRAAGRRPHRLVGDIPTVHTCTTPGGRHAELWDWQPHDPRGAGGAVGDFRPLHRFASGRVGSRRRHIYVEDKAQFWLDSDRAGPRAVDVSLLPAQACVVTGATEVPSDQLGMRRFERPERLPPDLRSTRFYLFDGGCVVYRFAFEGEANASLMFDAESALAFQPREELVEEVRERSGLRLCGAEAPPCSG